MHIIIDGYNLIRQSEDFRRAEKFGLEAGRNRLIDTLIQYRKLNEHEITVVFDGWLDGSPREEHYRKGGIDIVYSRRGEKADDVIKRMTSPADHEALVVTSDRAIAAAVEKKGIVALPSPHFEQKLWEGMSSESTGQENASGDNGEPFERVITTRKRGPARKLSKRERRTRKAVTKL